MVRILRDIYSDTSISSLLGFKGGTCAYLLYGLTRFSVDLDFDLFRNDEETQRSVYERISGILGSYGAIKDRYIKRNTIFLLLSYGDTDHNVKIEVNARILVPEVRNRFEIREYLGISMLTGKKEYLFASKLAALTDRHALAMRDIYDIWFFAKNNWDISAEVLKIRTGMSVKEYLAECITVIESVTDTEILRGLAELLPDEKAKAWVKTHLRKDVIFLLKNYHSVLP